MSKGLPALVKMQEAHGKDGLVVLGVTLDDPKDKKMHDQTVKFLTTKLKPPFRNVALNAAKKEWMAKFRVPTGEFPAVFVFNREGKYALKLPTYDANGEEKEPVDYDKVLKAVRELTRK